jgi:hypothetical protein
MVSETDSNAAAQRKNLHWRNLFRLPSYTQLMQSWGAWERGGAVMRELQLLAVSLVFLFLGAIVFGVIH